MPEAPEEKIIVAVRGREVVLDPTNMRFNEATLSRYFEYEYGWIDYFGKQEEMARREMLDAEIDAEALYSQKYLKCKDEGNTDGYAKAKATADPEVIAARKKYTERRETVGLLSQHIKAWSKNHENGQNRGNTLRAEFNKLGTVIKTDQPYTPMPDEGTCNIEDVFK